MMANIKLNLKDVHSTAMQVRLSVSDIYRSIYQKFVRILSVNVLLGRCLRNCLAKLLSFKVLQQRPFAL